MEQSEEEYLSADEAAEHLGISRSYFFRLVKQYGLRRYKRALSRQVFFKKEDIEGVKKPRPVD